MKLITEIDFKWKWAAIVGLVTVFIGMVTGMLGLKTIWADILLACVTLVVLLEVVFTTIRLYDGIKHNVWQVSTYKDKFDNRIMTVIMLCVVVDLLLKGDIFYTSLGMGIIYQLAVDWFILRKCKED